jgi:hypothetical protein
MSIMPIADNIRIPRSNKIFALSGVTNPSNASVLVAENCAPELTFYKLTITREIEDIPEDSASAIILQLATA